MNQAFVSLLCVCVCVLVMSKAKCSKHLFLYVILLPMENCCKAMCVSCRSVFSSMFAPAPASSDPGSTSRSSSSSPRSSILMTSLMRSRLLMRSLGGLLLRTERVERSTHWSLLAAIHIHNFTDHYDWCLLWHSR